MYHQDVELRVGDVLQIGDVVVTVVEIDGNEVSFRIDDSAQVVMPAEREDAIATLPR